MKDDDINHFEGIKGVQHVQSSKQIYNVTSLI